VNSLHEMLDTGKIRFFGNVEFGRDLKVEDIHRHYHAVIFATGAIKDAKLNIPGVDLEGSFGAADFVSWYDGHPDVSRTWPLTAAQVAVLGNGNVALDVARVLTKQPMDMLTTDIPDNVYQGLKSSPVTDVHVFGRRGPSDIKFTPIELRELGEVEDVEIVLYPEDFPEGWFNEDAEGVTNQHRVMARVLQSWLERDSKPAKRRLHLHFWHQPKEILGDDGRVVGMSFDRKGELREYPLQAVYRAIGYWGSELPEVPYDETKGVIRNLGGRVVDAQDNQISGLYATGWIKRGPVGLIGHTKSDAMETIENLVADVETLADPVEPKLETVLQLLTNRGVDFTDWAGWLKLNNHELALGTNFVGPVTRERVKVVDRQEQVEIARAENL
jgi:ferredoxin--NADP+ reductase